MHFKMASAICFNLDQSKILMEGNFIEELVTYEIHTYMHTYMYIIFNSRYNPLPDRPILGFSSSDANKDMAKEWTVGDTITCLSRKNCGKRRNCSLQAISPFSTIFSKAVGC